jgi:cytochrome c oxidase cbb3-type subunit 1
MKYGSAIIGTGIAAFFALLAAGLAKDELFASHMGVLVIVLIGAVVVLMRRTSFAPQPAADMSAYMDGPIRYGVIATVFWCVAGLLAGVVVALQLAYPDLNIEPFLSFGRVRPLHTSAVIFAFGGNVLLATSFYVVQRTCRARLAGDLAPWFVVLGYNFFIVIAGTGYLLGITQGKEYAEPEWYADLWLTIVWVVLPAWSSWSR